MEVLNERIDQRRVNNQFYQDLFQDNPLLKWHNEPNADYFSNHWLSVACVSPEKGFSRAEIIQEFSDSNIETRPIWKPMYLQPIFKGVAYFGSEVSENLFNNGICLPSGSNLSIEDKARIENVLINVLS